MNYIV